MYWMRGSSLARRSILPAAVLMLIGVLGTVVVVADRRPAPSPPVRHLLGRPPAAAGTAVRLRGEARARRPAPPGPAPGVAPLRVVRRVATALWSFNWAQPPGAELSALRPWVTAGVWAEFATSPGAPAASAAAIREREVARVVSVTVTVADRSTSGLGVAVSALVAVDSGGHPQAAGREDAEMLVIPTASGWRVADIDI
jgi:hypothetical protein